MFYAVIYTDCILSVQWYWRTERKWQLSLRLIEDDLFFLLISVTFASVCLWVQGNLVIATFSLAAVHCLLVCCCCTSVQFLKIYKVTCQKPLYFISRLGNSLHIPRYGYCRHSYLPVCTLLSVQCNAWHWTYIKITWVSLCLCVCLCVFLCVCP